MPNTNPRTVTLADDETAALVDAIVTVVKSVVTQLTTTPNTPTMVEPQRPSKRRQDSEQHTCEVCGRVGTRRYEQTATGWRCAPSSAETCARNAATNTTPPRPPEPPKDTPPEPIPIPVTAVQPDDPPKLEVKVTARCRDCSRTFNLTGRALILACEMHELKHGHIVTVIEGAEAG